MEEIDLLAAQVARKIPYPALLTNLAEELSELSAVVLKMERIEREDNPTPASPAEIQMEIAEEWGDVLNVALVLGLTPSSSRRLHKMRRWVRRIEEREKEIG